MPFRPSFSSGCLSRGCASPDIAVMVTSIFLGGDLILVLLVTTVLPSPPGDCDRSPNLLE